MSNNQPTRTWVTVTATAVATASIYFAVEGLWQRVFTSSKDKSSQAKEQASIGRSLSSTSLDVYGGCIYLDYNATTPIFPEVTKAMSPFTWSCFGNPSSDHVYGLPCRDAVSTARAHAAAVIGADSPNCIIFTSCGTESDNRAIDIALHQYSEAQHRQRQNIGGSSSSSSSRGSHSGHAATPIPNVITCVVEHPAILGYLRHLEKTGAITLTVVGVDKEGFVGAKDIERALEEHKLNTALVTIMHSNNEVGTVQPLTEIGGIVRKFNAKHAGSGNGHRVLFHTDAAQSIGKIPVDVGQLGVDMLTFVGHKFGAPKGIGALYVRSDFRQTPIPTAAAAAASKGESSHYAFAPLSPLLVGGGQEGGARGGTESVLLIAGFGEACRIARIEAKDILLHMLQRKAQLITALRSGLSGQGAAFLQFNGPERSCDVKEIAADIGMLSLILKPISAVADAASASASASSSSSSSSSGSVSLSSFEEGSGEQSGSRGSSSSSDNSQFSRTCANLVEQLPNTVSVSFRDINAIALLPLLASSVACSAGSACHTSAKVGKMSAVLEAMQVDSAYGRGTLRLSLGRHTTKADIDVAAARIVSAVLSLIQSSQAA